MIRLRLKRFPPETIKKLHAHGAGPFRVIEKVGPNAYVLDLPLDMGISSTFNITNLVEYRKSVAIPNEAFGPTPSLVSDPSLECPPIN